MATKTSLSFRVIADSVRLEITDNGRGFDSASIPSSAPRGLGLTGMRERMAMIDGSLTIDTGSNGTRIVAVAPLPDSAKGGNDE